VNTAKSPSDSFNKFSTALSFDQNICPVDDCVPDMQYKLPSNNDVTLPTCVNCGAKRIRCLGKTQPTATAEQKFASFSVCMLSPSQSAEGEDKAKQLFSCFSDSNALRTVGMTSCPFLLRDAIVAVTNAAFYDMKI
jgi:hypothetical protein